MLFEPNCHACAMVGIGVEIKVSRPAGQSHPDRAADERPDDGDQRLLGHRAAAAGFDENTTVAANTPRAMNSPCTGTVTGPTCHWGTIRGIYRQCRRRGNGCAKLWSGRDCVDLAI